MTISLVTAQILVHDLRRAAGSNPKSQRTLDFMAGFLVSFPRLEPGDDQRERVTRRDSINGPKGSAEPLLEPRIRALGEGARLLLNAATFVGGRGVGRLVYLITQVFLGRFLAPFEFGLLTLGLSIYRLVELLGSLGLHAAVVRFAARRQIHGSGEARATILKGIWLATISGAVFGVSGFLAARFLATTVFHKPSFLGIMQIVAVGFPFATGLFVAAAATRNLRTARYEVLTKEVGQPVLFLLLAFLALRFHMGARGAAAALICSSGLSFLVVILVLLKLFPRGDPEKRVSTPTRTLLSFSLPAVFSSTSRFLVNWADRFVLGILAPAASLGSYQSASQLSAVFPIVLVGFGAMIGPLLVEHFASGDRVRIRGLYALSTRWAITLATPIEAILILAPGPALRITFGPAYVDASRALVILVLGQVIATCGGSLGVLLSMTGRERVWAALTGGAFALNATLNFLFIPRWGIVGASTATLLSLGLLTVAGLAEARKMLGAWPLDRRVAKAAGVNLIGLGLCWIVLPYLPQSDLARVVTLAVCALVVLVGGVALTGIDPEARELFALVKDRLGFRAGVSR